MFSHSHHIAMSIVEKVLLWDGHFRGSIASSSFTRSSCAWSNIASEAISEHLISNMLLVEHASRPPYRLHAYACTYFSYQSKLRCLWLCDITHTLHKHYRHTWIPLAWHHLHWQWRVGRPLQMCMHCMKKWRYLTLLTCWYTQAS